MMTNRCILIIAVLCFATLATSCALAYTENKKSSQPYQKTISASNKKNMIEDPLQYNPEWILDRDKLLRHSSCGRHTLDMKQPSQSEIKYNWDTAWKWAKRGNLQARELLMYRIMDEGLLSPKGKENRLRDIIILAVHSLGSDYDKKNMFLNIALEHIPKNDQSKKFWSCINEKLSQKCTKIAVNSKIVPSFDEYAREIENAVADGKQANCN